MATHLDDPPLFMNRVEDTASLKDRYSTRHDAQRLTRISKAWQFYLGDHWEFEREDGEPLITFNHLAELIEKKISFLMGADFTVNVPPALAHLTLPPIQRVWEDNGRQNLNYEIGQEGAVTGDIFVLITADAPAPEQLRYDPFTKYRIVIQRLSSHECFPTWDEDAPNTRWGRPMRMFTILRWFLREKPGTDGEEEAVQQTIQITNEWIRSKIGDATWKYEDNILGEIAVVHIKNKSSAHTNFGIDDVSDLIPLNKELNEKATDMSDIINYNAAPITVLIGARAAALERGPKSIWSLPLGATVNLLRLEGDLTSSISYFDRVKNAMHEISNVPVNALAGPDKKITGTTGETWNMQLVPLIDERNKKRATYEPGYERINYFILRYEQELNGLRLPKGVCEKCGGKIAILYEDDPENPGERIMIRRCFVMDKHTFGFLDPEKMKVPFLRVHSLGDEVTKVPVEQAEEEHGRVSSSYWDMAPAEAQKNFNDSKLPPGFKYPPEPERIELEEVIVQYDDIMVENDDGEMVPYSVVVQSAQPIFAIPIDCDQHTYLNPFTNFVTFNETMPKDKQKQAELFRTYKELGIVSRAYMMAQVGVDNPDEMYEQIQKEQMQEQAILNPPINQDGIPPGDIKPVAPNKEPASEV